jgi:hypothetical protein
MIDSRLIDDDTCADLEVKEPQDDKYHIMDVLCFAKKTEMTFQVNTLAEILTSPP